MIKYFKENFGSVLILLVILLTSTASLFVDITTVQNSIKNAGIWAPLIYIFAKASTMIIAPLSGTALYIVAVPLFGFWNAILYSFLGDLVGSTVTFYISRFFGQSVVRYFSGKSNMIYIEKALDTMSTLKGFVSMRLALITMSEIASYAAGLTQINFLLFITIHMIVDVITIFMLSLPGLLIVNQLPSWIHIFFIIFVVSTTIISFFIFIQIVKKTDKK